MALPAALWLAALVAVIGAGALMLSTMDARLSVAGQERAQARHWAEGVARLAALRLGEADPLYRAAMADGTPLRIEHEEGSAELRLSVESERLDLNIAEPLEIATLLIEQGVEQTRAERVAAALADFRDPDDLIRLGGAEAADYRAAGLDHEPLNRPFRHLSELALVMGAEGDIVAILAERGTIWGERPGPLTVERLEGFGEGADEAEDPALAWLELLGEAQGNQSDFLGGDAIRIHVAAATPSGALENAELIVLVVPSASPPFRILDWR